MFYDNLQDEVEHYKTEYLSAFTSENYNIIICIENYDDEPFWKFIFSKVENMKPFFHDMDGKNNILNFTEYFDNQFIACVDSDYDYILKKSYLDNPYIFHTYFYAVENYCVCAKTLNSLKNTLNINCSIDFESFFNNMTPLIREALFYDIYLKENNQDCIRNVFKFNNTNIKMNEEAILNAIQTKVLEALHEIDSDLLIPYQNAINKDIHINENFLYLYIEGHIIFDSILNILDKLQNTDIHSKIQIIRDNSDYTGEEKGNKINELKNKKFDIYTGLKLNYKESFFENHCDSFDKIISDINNTFVN